MHAPPPRPTTTAKNFLAGVGAGTIESIFGAFSRRPVACRVTPPKQHTYLTLHQSTHTNPVVTPVETVKTKLIHLNMEFVGGVKHIVAKEGLGGVYQGLGATIMKQVGTRAFGNGGGA